MKDTINSLNVLIKSNSVLAGSMLPRLWKTTDPTSSPIYVTP
jgi:hypothetical protein